MGKSGLQEAWSEGRYYLLPSFLKFLFHIAEAKDNEYNIVFRTFGDDIPEVSKEIEFLVNGTHPLFPGVRISLVFICFSTYNSFNCF